MRRSRRRIALGIVLAGVVAGTLVALLAARYHSAYRDALAARDDVKEAQAILQEKRLDASAAELAEASSHLDDAEGRFRDARAALDDPVLTIGSHLPLIGDTVKATKQLTDIGLEGVEVGRSAIEITRTFQRVRDSGSGGVTERTEEILSATEPAMSTIEDRLAVIHDKRAQVTGVALPPPLITAVEEIDRDLEDLLKTHATYEDVSSFLPDLLGFEGQRTYLLLAQNNAELLPTGGLISVYGVITVSEGSIVEKQFDDAVAFGGRWLEQSGAYIEPPVPLGRYLLRDVSWNFAVSNWSPDFPTAAEEAERFYSLAGGRPVDGVIAINVHTIAALLQVTGPVTVEEYGVTVTPENALDVIEEHTRTAHEPEGDRKALVGVLADELLSRLMDAPAEQWTPLLETVQQLRDERQVLLFSHDTEQQELIDRLRLDGALEAPAGDYVMLVDASVNSTKLNVALEQRIDLRVRLDDRGAAEHDVAVSYHNDLPGWADGRDPALVQRLMLGGVYGGYLRLLAPGGSKLESLTIDGREAGPEEVSAEQGKAVFGRFFALESGARSDVGLRYVTPAIVRRNGDLLEYRLYLQKQSGTDAMPVAIQLDLPDGARLESAELDGALIASLEHIETDLARDRELVVRYRID